MKISAFGAELVFDELVVEELPHQQRFVFITTLFNVHELPDKLPHIYTSEVLKAQLLVLCRNQGKVFNEAAIHVLKPFEVARIQTNDGAGFEVLPCMSTDMSTSFMLAIRQAPGFKITHLYAGLATDLSSMMVNREFAIWLNASGDSIDVLHKIDMGKDRCAHCETESAFKDLQNKMTSENFAKVLLEVPQFGCEALIALLANKYPGAVALDNLPCELFSKAMPAIMKFFTEDDENAAILISMEDMFMDTDSGTEAVYTKSNLKWLPLPDSYELNLLEMLVKPKSVNILENLTPDSYTIKITTFIYGTTPIDPKKENSPTVTNSCQCSKPYLLTKYAQLMCQYQKSKETLQEETRQEQATTSKSVSPDLTTKAPTRLTSEVIATTESSIQVETESEQTTTSIAAKDANEAAASKQPQAKLPSIAEKLANFQRSAHHKLVNQYGMKGIRFLDSSSSSDD